MNIQNLQIIILAILRQINNSNKQKGILIMNEKKNRSEKRTRVVCNLWIIISLIISIGFGLFSLIQINNYEDSVLDIYADSQDAYVQLVLDQINLVEDRTSTEIVSDILGTLDASSNRYWTFSSDDAIIFVKDVTETNRYKGFTASTYYITENAHKFINGLQNNKVVHERILINDNEYVASGVAFSYNGVNYQICLLTNPDTVLDHNVYLNAKINLSIAISVVLILFLGSTLFLSLLREHAGKELIREKKRNEELLIMEERMSAALERERLFDTQLSVFHYSVLPMMLEKLEQRAVSPVTIVYLTYETEEDKKRFLLDGQIMLDQHVFRFQNKEEKKLALVTVQCNRNAVMTALSPLLNKSIKLVRIVTTETMDEE